MPPLAPDNIQSILCVRFGRLGDILLLLPALASLKARLPGRHLALATDHRYARAAELCPAIDAVIPIDRLRMRDGSKPGALKAMTGLVQDIRRRRFDLVIDFHGFIETQLLAGLSGARHRLGMHRHRRAYLRWCFNLPPVPEDKTIHVAEMFARIASAVAPGTAAATPRPLLRIPAEADAQIRSRLPEGRRIAFYVGARAADHLWPPERFAALADRAIDEFSTAVVLIGGAGPDEARLPDRIRSLCKHAGRVHPIAAPELDILAAAIARCDLLVSNDSGPMHLGPALEVPTVGMFSLSDPLHYRPVGAHDEYLRAGSMLDISVDAVLEAVRRRLSACD